jgi:hypothetical protein
MKRLFLLGLLFITTSVGADTLTSTLDLVPGNYGDDTYKISFTLNKKSNVVLSFSGTEVRDHPHDYTTHRSFSDWSVANQNGTNIASGGWLSDQTYHFPSHLIDQNHPWTEGQDCTSYIGCEVTITRSTEEVELGAGTYEVTFDMFQGHYYNDGVMDFLGVFATQSNASSSCDTTYTLPNNQWRQISLPCNPGANNTVSAVFGDDIPGTYNTDWILYSYNGSGYPQLSETDTLSQGSGYWIIQKSGGDVVLSMPDNSTPTPVTQASAGCTSSNGCFEIGLDRQPLESTTWTMIGYPFASSESLGDVRVLNALSHHEVGGCDYNDNGCDLDTASHNDIVHNTFWTYNGSAYAQVDTSGNLDPWTGYWVATGDGHDQENPLYLMLPKP